MVFRRDHDGRIPRAKSGRKAAMASKIRCGTPVGVLANDESGEPVAWCSVAPRQTLAVFPGLEWPEGDRSTVWSVTCSYVTSGIRRAGVMSLLVEEAVAHARRNAAAVVEAYPVAPGSPSYRFPASCPCSPPSPSFGNANRPEPMDFPRRTSNPGLVNRINRIGP